MSRASAIEPARLSFDAHGVAHAERFDDIYFSADGGPAQSRHVFLAGNALPERWRTRQRFTIVETGFGLGLNFLSVCAAFEDDAARPNCLHFVSVEKHPPTRADLQRVHAQWPQLAAHAAELQRRWPPLLAGFHRLDFAAGRIVLTLLLGDAAEMLSELDARADAIFLDGFAPDRNPSMWSAAVFGELARLSRPGTTAATWSAAAQVKQGLRDAGFQVEKRPGFGRKRDMLSARRAPDASAAQPRWPALRHAIVIGAGLAGSWCTHALARRGWQVDVIERHLQPAREASGNAVGVVRPALNLADNANARLSRAAFLFAANRLAGEPELEPIAAAPGVLHVATTPVQAERMARIIDVHRFPSDYVAWVDRDPAARLAGRPVAGPGWWLPRGGWASPARVCEFLLKHAGEHVSAHFGRAATLVSRTASGWRVIDANGIPICEAPVLVLANAYEANRLQLPGVPELIPVRGQVTELPPSPDRRLDSVVCGDGYVVSLPGGGHCIGATFEPGSTEVDLRTEDHADNLARVERMLPGFAAGLSASSLSGRVALRTATSDRLPACGSLGRSAAEAAQDSGLYLLAGLGARGLIWAPLCAEAIAARLEHEPNPVECSLIAAMSPGRLTAGIAHRSDGKR